MHALSESSSAAGFAIGWLYLATNACRLFTYAPQIIAVWRCDDGARAISLLTWGSWTVSNVTACFYGWLVVNDPFFVAISALNLAGCGTVTAIAWRRRHLHLRWLDNKQADRLGMPRVKCRIPGISRGRS